MTAERGVKYVVELEDVYLFTFYLLSYFSHIIMRLRADRLMLLPAELEEKVREKTKR